jgi:hypothetical protein
MRGKRLEDSITNRFSKSVKDPGAATMLSESQINGSGANPPTAEIAMLGPIQSVSGTAISEHIAPSNPG